MGIVLTTGVRQVTGEAATVRRSGRRPGLVALVLAGAGLAVVGLAGCGSSGVAGSSHPAAPVQVVATTSVLADLVANVGGDRVGVYTVLRPNVDAHDLDPSPADLEAIRRARLVVENGAGLEPWLPSALDASGTRATVVDSSRDLALRRGDDHGADLDPHVWHDPRNVMAMVRTIATALAAADPANTSYYETNRDRYLAVLDALDREVAARIGALSVRTVVTDHDAFGYYADRYGLQLVGSVLPSFETSAEPSARRLRELADAIRAEHVPAVFTERALPARTARALADEAGVRVVAGDGALYGDALGPAGSGADT